MQEAIKKKYGLTAGLKEGVGGIFEVSIEGTVVYSNQTTYRFPTDAEIFERIETAKKR